MLDFDANRLKSVSYYRIMAQNVWINKNLLPKPPGPSYSKKDTLARNKIILDTYKLGLEIRAKILFKPNAMHL